MYPQHSVPLCQVPEQYYKTGPLCLLSNINHQEKHKSLSLFI